MISPSTHTAPTTTNTPSKSTTAATRTGDRLFLWWGLAGLAGFVGGMTIKTLIDILAGVGGFSAALEAIPGPLFGTLFGAMMGLCTGLGQWLILRRRLPHVGAWIPATLGAWMLFWTLHNAGAFGFAHTPFGLVIQGFGHGAIAGATFGAAQWLVLRNRIPNAARWILISMVSWSIAGAIMHTLLDVVLAPANLHDPFDVLIASTLAALFSGIGLQRLLATSGDTTEARA